MSESKKWWHAPWHFVVQTIIGVFMFGIIAAAAVALDLTVAYLKTKHIQWGIIIGLKGAEYALFGVDIILFGRFLWKTAGRTWKEL